MNKFVQMGAKYAANKLGIQDNPLVKAGLALSNPVGTAIDYFGPKVNQAMGQPSGTVEALSNPKGAAMGVAKDVVMDELRSSRNPVPVEDRSFPSRDMDTADYGREFKRGGNVKKMASGGSVSSASKRADGIAQRGKTKGRYL
jgi:hypothetical protein